MTKESHVEEEEEQRRVAEKKLQRRKKKEKKEAWSARNERTRRSDQGESHVEEESQCKRRCHLTLITNQREVEDTYVVVV